MSVYVRRDSRFYWVLLERPHLPPIKATTKIPRDAPDAMSRKLLRQQAEAVYIARMADLARARYDLPPLIEPAAMLFHTYADWYQIHHVTKHRGAERERYALAHLKRFIGPNVPLSSVSAALVSEYETARVGAGVKPRTVNREVAVLKALLRSAVPLYLKASPLAGRRHLRTIAPTKRVLSPDEETRLLAELRPRDRAFYIVAVDTLMRLSNVVNLQWSHVKRHHIELDDSKTGPYSVPLSDRAKAALDELKKDGPYCFPHRRRAKKARDVRGAIRRLLERACQRCDPPIPYGRAAAGITFHTATRATGATRMLRAGVDPKTVQRVGNWASMEQMSTYLQTDDALMRAAVNTIAPK